MSSWLGAIDRLGRSLINLVAEVTDDKSPPKECRKEMQVQTAHKKSPRAKVIKLADKTSKDLQLSSVHRCSFVLVSNNKGRP
jgi:hypothetical protein